MTFVFGFICGSAFGLLLLKRLAAGAVVEGKRESGEAKENFVTAKVNGFLDRMQPIRLPDGHDSVSAIRMMRDAEDDDSACERCHRTMDIPSGFEETKYCHNCAQELVAQYESDSLPAEDGAEGLPPLPPQWPIEGAHDVTHVYATLPVDQFREEALDRIRVLTSMLAVMRRDDGASLIAKERHRQIHVEGWTPEHDSAHQYGELAKRGAALALSHTDAVVMDDGEVVLPWKEHPEPRSLVIAGALIAAEIDNLLSTQPLQKDT